MGRPSGCFKPLRPYAEARAFVHTLNLFSAHEWYEWSKSGQRPADIPGNPRQYRQEWTCWPDWLGHDDGRGRKRLSSAEREQRLERLAAHAQKTAQRLVENERRRAEREQRRAEREQKKAQRLAEGEQKTAQRLVENERRRAEREQRRAESAAAQKKTFCGFYQAREFARSLNLSSIVEWWAASGKRPANIPANPSAIYKAQFSGWPDFLGYESRRAQKRAKEVIKLEQARAELKRALKLAAEQARADIACRREEIRKYEEETRYTSKVKIVFFERCDSASRFYSLADAEAAAAQYSADRRYGCEAFHCEKCSAEKYNRAPWHVRPRSLAGRVFMHPETKRWCITLPVAVDPREERWSPNAENLCIGSAETGVLAMDECQSTC
jgi:hypothetical protein